MSAQADGPAAADPLAAIRDLEQALERHHAQTGDGVREQIADARAVAEHLVAEARRQAQAEAAREVDAILASADLDAAAVLAAGRHAADQISHSARFRRDLDAAAVLDVVVRSGQG